MNTDYRYQLETRKLTGRRQQKTTCPQCGRGHRTSRTPSPTAWNNTPPTPTWQTCSCSLRKKVKN